MGELASRGKRFLGAMVDSLIVFLVMLPIMFIMGVFSKIDSNGQLPIGLQIGLAIAGIVLFVILNGQFLAQDGQTLGKKIISTRIVGIDDQPVNFVKIYLIRYLAVSLIVQIPIAGAIFGLVDALFIFSNKDKRCLHDLMAGTKVIDAK